MASGQEFGSQQITKWLTERKPEGNDNPGVGTLTLLYEACLQALALRVRALRCAPGNLPADFNRLSISLSHLHCWGEGLLEGQLEICATKSRPLKTAILEALIDLGIALLLGPPGGQHLSRFVDSATKANSLAVQLSALVDMANSLIPSDAGILQADEESDSSSMLSEASSDSSWFCDVSLSVDLLCGTAPEIECLLADDATRKNSERTQSVIDSTLVEHPAHIYISYILEKYEAISQDLACRMGEVNLSRLKRLHARLSGTTEASAAYAKSHVPTVFDSGMGASMDAVDVPAHAQTLQDSAIETPLQPEMRAAQTASVAFDQRSGLPLAEPSTIEIDRQSLASFGTQLSLLESVERRALPVKPEAGELCPICNQHLPQGTMTASAWRHHVFDDLQPYVCTSSSCDMVFRPTGDFETWASHVLAEHRRLGHWLCGACELYFETETAARSHLCQTHGSAEREESMTKELMNMFELQRDGERKCELCGHSRWTSIKHYLLHLVRHLEDILLTTISSQAFEEEDESQEVGRLRMLDAIEATIRHQAQRRVADSQMRILPENEASRKPSIPVETILMKTIPVGTVEHYLQVVNTFVELEEGPVVQFKAIFDSGANINLISERCLRRLGNPPITETSPHFASVAGQLVSTSGCLKLVFGVHGSKVLYKARFYVLKDSYLGEPVNWILSNRFLNSYNTFVTERHLKQEASDAADFTPWDWPQMQADHDTWAGQERAAGSVPGSEGKYHDQSSETYESEAGEPEQRGGEQVIRAEMIQPWIATPTLDEFQLSPVDIQIISRAAKLVTLRALKTEKPIDEIREACVRSLVHSPNTTNFDPHIRLCWRARQLQQTRESTFVIVRDSQWQAGDYDVVFGARNTEWLLEELRGL